jgi:hypothetical protein
VPDLLALSIADPIDLWRHLGFTVAQGGACRIGGLRLQLGAAGHGIVGWELTGVDSFDELPTAIGPPGPTQPIDMPTSGAAEHPNGVTTLDHVVVATPDLSRTIVAFETAGVSLRRTREAAPTMTQAFFKLGQVIIEVIGSPTAADPGPATFWGLTFTVTDLNATAVLLGERLRPVKEAVQRGRRIATLDRAAGSSVPIAFMSN